MNFLAALMTALVAFPLATLASPFPSAAIPKDLLPRQAPQPGQVITRCNRPGVIALTFDDGPGQYGTQLLNTLQQGGAKATFFVTGTLYGCIYSRAQNLKSAYAAGHQIPSHTWTHGDLAGKGTGDIQNEMSRLEQALVNIIGVKPTYMRPPYGSTGGQMQTVMRNMGYKIITWDIDSGDWNNQSPSSSLQKFQQAGAGGNGHIPLMHETVQSTATQLTGMVINWAKQNNLRMVTVAECLGDSQPYAQGTGGGNQNC